MNRLLCLVAVGLAATFLAVPATAQTAQCSQAQPVVTGLLEDASKRLEAARLTNSAAAMRDAADDVQSALVDVRAQLAPCAQMATSAPASAPGAQDAHAGHVMPSTPTPAPAASTARPAPPMPPTAITALKCGAPVDPKTAPRMLYQGQMYYFCSEQERAAFAKDPGTPATAPTQGTAPAHAHCRTCGRHSRAHSSQRRFSSSSWCLGS